MKWEWEYKSKKFALNKNHYRNEFEGKYYLLIWRDRWWHIIITCDSKAEAVNYIKQNYLYL